MKKYMLILVSFLMSCSGLIDPPKNLVDKKTMSEVIAQFAINDQINNYIPNTDIENATRMTLKQKNIKAADFIESYKYYTATGELEKVLNASQEIILSTDPAAKKYIDKRIQENQNVPAFAR